jgi:hypothetical protein
MWEEIKSGQVEMKFTICAFLSETEETIQREMRAVIQPVPSVLEEMTACNKATETEPDSRMMQFIEAAVMPAGDLQKRKETTREYLGNRRNSAAASNEVSRSAKVAEEINRLRQEDDQPFKSGMAH